MANQDKTRFEILWDYAFHYAVAHEPRFVGEEWCPIKLKNIKRMMRELKACND